jgi:transglutaminase-like putative cysteine protease
VLRVPRGDVVVDYTATVAADGPPRPAPTLEEQLVATRPSRYVDSDRLVAVAGAELAGLHGARLATAATAWVHDRLAYVPGSSRPTDGATDTLLAGQGVCRDYAHLVTGLLRALDVPARVAAVYAPGLDPMDFHAVAEAWLDGGWWVLDATGLAPRSSLVRIGTGRDTADTAFLTSTGPVRMGYQQVIAVADPDLPVDPPGLVALG